jgi:outer membrane receptor protein involved in Fe transport
MEIIAVDDQVFGGDFANELERLDAYQVVNAHLSYDYKNWVLGVRVNNLLDEEYSEIGNLFVSAYDPVTFLPSSFEPAFFPSPERNFWLSAKVSF